MFKLANEAALLATFRPIDRKHVVVTHDVRLPSFVPRYLTWHFGRRVYLVFALPGAAPKGIVFEAGGAGPPVPHMCTWCQHSGLGTQVGLLTARRTRERTAGVLVCSDLGCRERIEELAMRAGADAEPALLALLRRMERFAETLHFAQHGAEA
jgi:hypothetical protein